ncbi:pilus assembly protein [Novosphingobium sp. MW5]|nr:pilus assembly protein [Novosphingobium sp. MW5]
MIETALVLPPLLALSIGSFEMSRIIARQADLQKAANEASDIVRAALPDTESKRATIKSVIMSSTGLTSDKVTIGLVYRCSTAGNYSDNQNSCGSGGSTNATVYIKLVMTDSYTPIWQNYGMGSRMNYSVTRYVQIG